MTSRKLIQNFRLGRAYLLADAEFPRETLERALTKLGMSLLETGSVDFDLIDRERDVIFLDGDQPVAPARLISPAASVPPAPLIGLIGVEAPSRLRMLTEAGATSFLRKPVAAGAVYSALFFGVNLHRRLRATEERLAAQERRRHQRRFVTKAVITLVQTHGLSDDDAYAALRRDSMRLRLNVEDYCERLFGHRAEGLDGSTALPIDRFIIEQEETARARISDAGRGPDDVDDVANGRRRRADQARRA